MIHLLFGFGCLVLLVLAAGLLFDAVHKVHVRLRPELAPYSVAARRAFGRRAARTAEVLVAGAAARYGGLYETPTRPGPARTGRVLTAYVPPTRRP